MPSLCAVLSVTRRPKVAQQVGSPNAKLAVFIQEAGLEFRARDSFDFRQQFAKHRFLGTFELMIVAQVAQHLTCNGANYPRHAII
jgi:hypothetical protein